MGCGGHYHWRGLRPDRHHGRRSHHETEHLDSERMETGHEEPHAILKRRLALGEITPEEYQKLRDLIQQG